MKPPNHRLDRPAPRRARRSRRRSLAALVWALSAFAGLQLLMSMSIDIWQPQWRDPEYALKLTALKQRLAKFPGEPLILALGTSRIAFGLRGDVARSAALVDDRPALVFNFGVLGGGPLYELVFLHRLLTEGIRPELVLIEVHPPLLNSVSELRIALAPDARRCDIHDLGVLLRNVKQPAALCSQWLRLRLAPCHGYRHAFLCRMAPAWVTGPPELDVHSFSRADEFGWVPSPWKAPSEAERRGRSLFTVEAYEPLIADFAVSSEADGALREMIEVCRGQGIGAALVIMPEESTYRRIFTQRTQARADAYLDRLCRQYGVPLIDAREWCGDADFSDGQHLLPNGAEIFTARLAGEALRPWSISPQPDGRAASVARQPGSATRLR